MTESSEDMIFLGIRSKSEIAWKPVNGNNLSPANGRLYKGWRAHKWSWLVHFGRKIRERKRERERGGRVQTWREGVNKGSRGV